VLYTFIKDALLSKNGIVKVFWDKTEREERETYHDQPDDAFAIMAADPDAEIIEHTSTRTRNGEVTHDVTLVKRKKSYGCARSIRSPEEFGISKYARTIKDANYCFHEVRERHQSDLIEQGYDEAQVKSLPTASRRRKEETGAATRSTRTRETDTMNKASRLIKVIEHYVRMDYEGNGKPCALPGDDRRQRSLRC
jgi:hypothetical protein